MDEISNENKNVEVDNYKKLPSQGDDQNDLKSFDSVESITPHACEIPVTKEDGIVGKDVTSDDHAVNFKTNGTSDIENDIVIECSKEIIPEQATKDSHVEEIGKSIECSEEFRNSESIIVQEEMLGPSDKSTENNCSVQSSATQLPVEEQQIFFESNISESPSKVFVFATEETQEEEFTEPEKVFEHENDSVVAESNLIDNLNQLEEVSQIVESMQCDDEPMQCEALNNDASLMETNMQPMIEEPTKEIAQIEQQPTVNNSAKSSTCNITKNIPAEEAVPLIAESILSALSEIHGENSHNCVPSVRGNSFVEITADTLKKVVNKNNLLKNKSSFVKAVGKRGRPALNDKQLLAILQDGSEAPTKDLLKDVKIRKRKIDLHVERQLALKQLREIPRKRKNRETLVDRIEDVKIPKVLKKKVSISTPTKEPTTEPSVAQQTSTPAKADISSIIDEWTEEDISPPTQDSICEASVNSESTTESHKNASVINNNVSNEESFIKPKRVARIIKKKIIYDPDNPETFKFASNIVQAAVASEIQTKILMENKNKVQQTNNENKLNKAEGKQSKLISVSTMPPADLKNTKLNPVETKLNKSTIENKTPSKIVTKKRLSEVDKLLMDEGAVNMLYQIEQSNNDGEENLQVQSKKKNTSISNEKKVKIIKKAVINHTKHQTDQPIKVFRVRKEKLDASNLTNNLKLATNTAARVSMQSPSLSEISAVSVNESRIIRRHSSSSFSSGCLSPRPQSPSGDATNASLNPNSGAGTNNKIVKKKGSRQKKSSKVVEKTENTTSSITQISDVVTLQMKAFTQLAVDLSDDITHIVINPTGNQEELYDYQVITELTAAIRLCSNTNTVLLSSSQGSLCGGLDLRGLVKETSELQRHHAEQLLDALRELMVTLCECQSPLVCCVGGACIGLGVALLTLCDLALASDRATFCVVPRTRRKLPPEGAALLTRPYGLPPQISRELVLCGRKLTASEALQRGIISRTLWPDRFIEEVRSIAKDLGQYPSESFSINKNILRRGEVTAVTSALRHEGRLLLDYWCSSNGQEAIKETHAHL